jgi:hypothetical protein
VVIPLSGRVSGRASEPSQSRIDDGGSLQSVFWKRVRALGFSRQGEYIGGRAMSGGGPGNHTPWWHGQGGPRHHMVWPASGPPPPLLWTPSSCQVIRDINFSFVQF